MKHPASELPMAESIHQGNSHAHHEEFLDLENALGLPHCAKAYNRER
jgi:hypothetical protein